MTDVTTGSVAPPASSNTPGVSRGCRSVRRTLPRLPGPPETLHRGPWTLKVSWLVRDTRPLSPSDDTFLLTHSKYLWYDVYR